MKFFDLKESTQKLFTLDVIKLIGLEQASGEVKQKIYEDLQRVTLEYLLQVKLAESLTTEELTSLMSKYTTVNDETVEALIAEIGALVPDMADKFTDAMLEVKARFIQNNFEIGLKGVEELFATESDPELKAHYQKQIDMYKSNLQYIENGQWELVQVN